MFLLVLQLLALGEHVLRVQLTFVDQTQEHIVKGRGIQL